MANLSIPRTSGIYVIVNTKSGKVYIGKTTNGFGNRQKEHMRALRGGYHGNHHLQSAWNKYGSKSFRFLILEYCESDKLNEREKHYIAIYKARGLAYNLTDGGDGGAGCIPNAETRAKLSASHKGKKLPPRSAEMKARINEARKGKPGPMKGKKFSPEHRAKLSIANKGTTPAPHTIEAAIASHVKTYILTSPDGDEIRVTNLAKFCRENGLCNKNLTAVMSGRVTHHKGWKCRHA